MTVQPPVPSGVSGLTSTQIRVQLARMGWTGALPIHSHDGGHSSRGKAPGITGWQRRAMYEGPETTAEDLKAWERNERKWPGTGIACGNVVAIDADFATDAALAETVVAIALDVFGETPFIRQGQAPKVALIYRAAEAMPSVHLKAADGSNDGLDVLCQGTQFVAYGVHHKTLKPYAWIGAESPLTAGPDEAPEVTQAQVDEFVARVRRVVELNGTGGRKGRGGGGGHQIIRGADGRVTDGRELGIIGSDEEADPEAAGSPKRVITDLMRLIRLRAALVWPRVVVVIGPMRLVEVLTDAGLPENVETAHFGAVAGIDRWSTAAGLICVGRLQPGPGIVEPLGGIITGTVPHAIPPNPKGGGRWYPRVAGAVRLASGQGVRVERGQHPDSMVEALRWQITEAGLIQAIGRLRALRRGPDAPAFLDIINDVPLPISVDATPAWDEAKPGAWAEMAVEGVLLESAADIMACFPEAASTRQAAREMALPTLVVTSIRDISIDVTTSVRRASYKRLGRFPQASAVLLPNAPADLKSWLSDRLGAIEWVKIEDPAPAKEAAPQPASAAAPRWPRCADLAPDLAAAYRLVVDVPAPAPRPHVPVIPEIVRWTPPPPRRRPVLRVVALEAAE